MDSFTGDLRVRRWRPANPRMRMRRGRVSVSGCNGQQEQDPGYMARRWSPAVSSGKRRAYGSSLARARLGRRGATRRWRAVWRYPTVESRRYQFIGDASAYHQARQVLHADVEPSVSRRSVCVIPVAVSLCCRSRRPRPCVRKFGGLNPARPFTSEAASFPGVVSRMATALRFRLPMPFITVPQPGSFGFLCSSAPFLLIATYLLPRCGGGCTTTGSPAC